MHCLSGITSALAGVLAIRLFSKQVSKSPCCLPPIDPHVYFDVMMKKSEQFLPKVEAEPDNMLFRFSLGQALYEEGAVAESVTHLQRCADSQADWMLPRILLGKALLQNGSPKQARPILEHALQLAIEQNHEGPEGELRVLLNDL